MDHCPPSPDSDPSLPGLLRLSPRTRQDIYLLVGLGPGAAWLLHPVQPELTRPSLHNLARHQHRPGPNSEQPPDQETLGFHGLLVSCRTVYTEASALLYSSNHFVLRYEDGQSLAPLRALTPATVASLTNLRVILNQSSCHWLSERMVCCDDRWASGMYSPWRGPRNFPPRWSPRPCQDGVHADGEKHGSPLHGSDAAVEAVLGEWQTAAEHLASHARPGRLVFSLVCDVDPDDYWGTARAVVAPLARFPVLKDCRVRLSRAPDPRMRELARRTVMIARGMGVMDEGLSEHDDQRPAEPPSAPGRLSLLTLPREVRLRILEYTDLITPLREVIWTRQDGGRYVASQPRCLSWMESAPDQARSADDPHPRDDRHHACQFYYCSLRATYPDLLPGCFCRATHGAFASGCRCWTPPGGLFRVCRVLGEDAGSVFFSGNKFVVMDGPALDCVLGPPPVVPGAEPGYQHARLAASHFLRDVVPAGCLAHLRFLELVFPPYTNEWWPSDNHPAVQDWANTIRAVQGKVNAAALVIRLVAPYHTWDDRKRVVLEVAQAQNILGAYLDIAKPLVSLCKGDSGGSSGGASFYAQLTWPMRRTGQMMRQMRSQEALAMVEKEERDLKEMMERWVLGHEGYDRQCATATEPGTGAWRTCLSVDFWGGGSVAPWGDD